MKKADIINVVNGRLNSEFKNHLVFSEKETDSAEIFKNLEERFIINQNGDKFSVWHHFWEGDKKRIKNISGGKVDDINKAISIFGKSMAARLKEIAEEDAEEEAEAAEG